MISYATTNSSNSSSISVKLNLRTGKKMHWSFVLIDYNKLISSSINSMSSVWFMVLTGENQCLRMILKLSLKRIIIFHTKTINVQQRITSWVVQQCSPPRKLLLQKLTWSTTMNLENRQQANIHRSMLILTSVQRDSQMSLEASLLCIKLVILQLDIPNQLIVFGYMAKAYVMKVKIHNLLMMV